MAKDETKRLTPKRLATDVAANAALKKITGYTPANADYTVVKLTTLFATKDAMIDAEAQAFAAYKAARDNAVKAEWDAHNGILGAKDQVIAQFGKSSNELQSLGLKKKTEYKRPVRKAKKNP